MIHGKIRSTARDASMHIQPSNATLGATVTDIDLADVDDADFTAIESAWHRFAVLVFPSQHLSEKNHLAFTRRFDRLERGSKASADGGGNRSLVQCGPGRTCRPGRRATSAP